MLTEAILCVQVWRRYWKCRNVFLMDISTPMLVFAEC
jgi:hypothetical protein